MVTGVTRTTAGEILGVPPDTLRTWERSGFLPRRGRGSGRFTPAIYNLEDILAAAAVSFLRSQNATLAQIRAARRTLAELKPTSGRIVVRSNGEVLQVRDGAAMQALERAEMQTIEPGGASTFLIVNVSFIAAAVEERSAQRVGEALDVFG